MSAAPLFFAVFSGILGAARSCPTTAAGFEISLVALCARMHGACSDIASGCICGCVLSRRSLLCRTLYHITLVAFCCVRVWLPPLQGHVRVGPETVTDPAFHVTRSMEDFVTWVDTSRIKRKVLAYNDRLDDYDLLQ